MNLLARCHGAHSAAQRHPVLPQYAGHDRRLLHPAGQRRTVRLLSGPPLQRLRPQCRGRSRGILAFYYPTSANGRRAAELFVENLRDIYPLPEKVSTRATASLGEIRQPRFPSVLLELGYHDNPDDALWIQENIPRIAANLVLSLTEYFGLPYTAPTPQPGQVSTVSGGPVNLRSGPSLQSTVTARLPDGDGVTVYGRYQDWYVVSHGEHLGYVSAPFIRLS